MPMNQPTDPLRGFRGEQVRFERETRQMLERTAKDIRARVRALPQGVGGQVRAAQLNLVLSEIHRLNNVMWTDDLVKQMQSGKGKAALTAEKAMETLNRVLTASLPSQAAQAVSESLSATARAGIEASLARTPRALSDRVWDNSRLANGKIDDLIRRGLAQGLSATELAKTVYQFASPGTPGGQAYAAMRLARTEINNAFHNQQRANGDQIGVLGTKWNLSDSHPQPDECDDYAAYDGGMGEGVWPKGEVVPDRPHPHCFCYLSYVTLTPREFADSIRAGDFDDELDRRIRSRLEGQI